MTNKLSYLQLCDLIEPARNLWAATKGDDPETRWLHRQRDQIYVDLRRRAHQALARAFVCRLGNPFDLRRVRRDPPPRYPACYDDSPRWPTGFIDHAQYPWRARRPAAVVSHVYEHLKPNDIRRIAAEIGLAATVLPNSCYWPHRTTAFLAHLPSPFWEEAAALMTQPAQPFAV